MKTVESKFYLLVLILALSASMDARAEVFGRSQAQLRNLGAVLNNGVLDFSFGIPPDQPNFSRLSTNRTVFPAAQANEADRRIDGRDSNSGFVVRNLRIFNDGLVRARFADGFGNAQTNFSAFTPIDTELKRQAEKFFIDNVKLGKPNDKFAVLEASFDNTGNKLRNLIADRFAANNLAMRSLSQKQRQGIGEFQCQMDGANGQPLDLLAGTMNSKDKEIAEYKRMKWEDRCVAMVSAALNSLVPPDKPPIEVNRSMVNSQTGRITIPNLGRSFTARQLASLLAKQDNTQQLCNSDNPGADPVPSVEFLVKQANTPGVYNSVLWDQDMNRSLLAYTGVNMLVPSQLRGNFGRVFETYIDNKDSKVATSGGGQGRKIEVYQRGDTVMRITLDTNSAQNGVKNASQNPQQAGRNNLGFAQSEGFIDKFSDYKGMKIMRVYNFLAAAPAVDAKDNTVKMLTANEAPASAAHTGDSEVNSTTCTRCHSQGPMLPEGEFTNVAVKNTYTNQILPPVFSQERQGYENYLKATNQYVVADKDPKNPSNFQKYRPVLWDAGRKADLARSPGMTAVMMGFNPGEVEGLLGQNNIRQGLDKEGNFTASWLRGGGACLIRNAVNAGRQARRGQPAAPNALASGNQAPKPAAAESQRHL